MGIADHVAAGGDALFQPGGIGHWPQRYQTNLQEEKDIELYNRRYRPEAYWAGVAGGTAIGLKGGGAFKAAPTLKYVPGAAGLSTREGVVLLGGGAASGIASQWAGDKITGHRSTAGDLIGAGVGSTLGSAVSKFNSAWGGAVDGATTSVAQDLLNGREISLEGAARAASAGGYVAGKTSQKVTNKVTKYVAAKPIHEKGKLGEAMGAARSVVNGYVTDINGPWRHYLPKGGYMVPDDRSGRTILEYKFGPGASLSKGQKAAKRELGEDFIIYQIHAEDIGKLAGIVAGPIGAQFALQFANRLAGRNGPRSRPPLIVHKQR